MSGFPASAQEQHTDEALIRLHADLDRIDRALPRLQQRMKADAALRAEVAATIAQVDALLPQRD